MSQDASLVLERQPLSPTRRLFIKLIDTAAIRLGRADFWRPRSNVTDSVTLAAGTFDGDRVATQCVIRREGGMRKPVLKHDPESGERNGFARRAANETRGPMRGQIYDRLNLRQTKCTTGQVYDRSSLLKRAAGRGELDQYSP
jgi:hypothetical protein